MPSVALAKEGYIAMRCVPFVLSVVALAKADYVGIEIEQDCGFGTIDSVPSASSVLIRNNLFTKEVDQNIRLLRLDGRSF